MSNEPQDQLIGSDEASKICGVHRATFLRWVEDGDIDPVHQLPGTNGAKLFSRAEVIRLRDERHQRILARRSS